MKRAIAAAAITLSVIGGAAIVGRLDRTAPATTTAPITTYKQPAAGVYASPPPPIKEAEKESDNGQAVDATRVSTPAGAGEVVRNARRSARNDGAVRQSGGAGPVVHGRVEALVTVATDDPYRDTMLLGGSKWETPISTVPAINRSAPATTLFNSMGTSAINASAVATSSLTTISTTTAAGCLTIATDFQQDCATANRWLNDIGTRYGAQMQRHHRWLTAATVHDWSVNGCSPSPCDANGTGRIQPTDYYGAQGYDSPLGTCHSTTPFRRAGAGRCSQQSDELGCNAPGAMSTLGVLGGTKGDDGKVRGWVRWHGDWYAGVVEDATCTDSCAVGFDHPCDLSSETEQPARRWDVAGKMFYSWWYGGDVNGEPPW